MLRAFIRYKRANYTNIRYTKRSTIRLHVIRGTQYTTIHWFAINCNHCRLTLDSRIELYTVFITILRPIGADSVNLRRKHIYFQFLLFVCDIVHNSVFKSTIVNILKGEEDQLDEAEKVSVEYLLVPQRCPKLMLRFVRD